MDAPSHHKNPQRKKGKGEGRSKIKLEKIENKTNLQVTFSKRRAGLFKKASELDTLCGCKSVVIAFSPSQKAYSYGNPDVETVAEMFLNQAEGLNHQIEGHDDPMTGQFSQVITDLETQVEQETREKKEHKKMRQETHCRNGSVPNLDELDYQQLDELKKSVLNFKQNIEAIVQNPIDQSWIEGGIVHPSGYVGDHYGPFPDTAGPFFSEMTAIDTGYVDLFVPPMNDNMGIQFQNPYMAGGSNPVDAQRNTDEGVEDTFFPSGYAENNNQGFPSNYGGAGFN